MTLQISEMLILRPSCYPKGTSKRGVVSGVSLALGVLIGVSVGVLGQGAHAYSLSDALRSAQERPAVSAAQLEISGAQDDLTRTDADPFALALAKTQAEQRLELSRAAARAALYTALSEIGSAYTAQLQADREAEAARENEALTRRLLEVARIRLERGSVTELEVREAEANLSVAEAARAAAEETLTLSRTSLQALLPTGTEAEPLEPIPERDVERPLPSVAEVLEGASDAPALLEVQQALVLARMQSGLLDPSYSSAREVEVAGTALGAAQVSLAETVRSQNAQIRTLYAQSTAAQELYRAQKSAAQAARERLNFQQNRFSRGLISDLELRQSEYTESEARLELLRAKHAYVTSVFDLQAAAATELWPLDEPGAAAGGGG